MPNWIQSLDEQILLWIESHRLPFFNRCMVVYTHFGDAGLAFIAVALLLFLFKKTRCAGGTALTGMTLGMVVTNLTIKPLMSRPRPWVAMEGFNALVRSSDMNSFPSGHTCAAFAFAAALCSALPGKWGKAAAVIAALLMGFSRVYVGVHFPSDVLAGAVVGTLCGLTANCIVKWALRLIRSHQSDLPPRRRP